VAGSFLAIPVVGAIAAMIEPAIGGALRRTPERSGSDHAFCDRPAKVVAEPQDLLLADRRPLAIQR